MHTADEQVTVRVPLAGPVSGEWLRCYQRLARATGVPVVAQSSADRGWLVVSVPASGNRGEVTETMNAARALARVGSDPPWMWVPGPMARSPGTDSVWSVRSTQGRRSLAPAPYGL
jgi:hypothetical protein